MTGTTLAATPAYQGRGPGTEAYAFVLTLALVAVPGFAAIKFMALVATLGVGILRGDFRTRGLLIGYSVVLTLGAAWAVATLGTVEAADRDSHVVRIFSFYAAFACLTLVRRGFRTQVSIDRLCLSAAGLMAIFKTGILVAIIAFGIPMTDALDLFGFESVTATIGDSLFRLQFPSDFVVLFMLACYTGGRSARIDCLFIFAVGIVIFLSFSRFIFLCFFVGIVVRALWLRRADLITLISVVLAVATLAVFAEALVDRFVGEGSDDSDLVRVEQIQKLVERIEVHPLLGSGAGASLPNFLRSETIPYSYEVQWHATVMQLGLLGTAALLLNVVLLVFWGVRRSRSRWCLAILLAMWILAGFTNPFITSLGSAVGLSIARRRAQLVE